MNIARANVYCVDLTRFATRARSKEREGEREREPGRERERLTEIGTEIERQKPNHVLENFRQPCVLMFPGLIGGNWPNLEEFSEAIDAKRLCSTYFAHCWCPRPSGIQ